MVNRNLDFEQDYQVLKDKILELKNMSQTKDIDLSGEIVFLEARLRELRENKYHNLTPWEQVLLARHPDRPLTRDYAARIFDSWLELHGDREFSDDPAIVGGLAEFDGMAVTVIGHQKGKNTADNLLHNFGMPHPEGYRKAHRLLLQAEKFHRPVITFINTPGADPGIAAEERGQGWAISEMLITLSRLRVPVISVVIGEGGSGGALALAVADRVIMLSNSVFSVTSPEACASILTHDPEKVEQTAAALKITAGDLLSLGIIDEVIPEPVGGAHEEFEAVADMIKERIAVALQELMDEDMEILLDKRYQKIRNIGRYQE